MAYMKNAIVYHICDNKSSAKLVLWYQKVYLYHPLKFIDKRIRWNLSDFSGNRKNQKKANFSAFHESWERVFKANCMAW